MVVWPFKYNLARQAISRYVMKSPICLSYCFPPLHLRRVFQVKLGQKPHVVSFARRRLPEPQAKYRAEMDILTVLPSSFGYVIFTYLYSWVMLGYLAVKVGSARKKYDVKVPWSQYWTLIGLTSLFLMLVNRTFDPLFALQYPTMYSDKEQVFNCIQRAHQNTLEVYPQWLVFQTIAALVYPVCTHFIIQSTNQLVCVVSILYFGLEVDIMDYCNCGHTVLDVWEGQSALMIFGIINPLDKSLPQKHSVTMIKHVFITSVFTCFFILYFSYQHLCWGLFGLPAGFPMRGATSQEVRLTLG